MEPFNCLTNQPYPNLCNLSLLELFYPSSHLNCNHATRKKRAPFLEENSWAQSSQLCPVGDDPGLLK